jgi:hypothetical protein
VSWHGLRPFVAAGRRAQGKSTRTTGARSSSGGNPETVKIRACAKVNGYEVSDRGRIHQSVKDAFSAAQ